MSVFLPRVPWVAALALAVSLPLGAQIVGQQQNTAAAPTATSAAASDAASAARLKSSTEFVLGKWDELQAEAHGGQNYAEGALLHFRAAIAANPSSAYLASQLADLLSRLGRAPQALELAKKTVQQHPQSIIAHKTLGEIYLRELGRAPQPITDASSGGAMSAAIANYQDLLRLDPHDATYIVVLGKLYGAEGNAAAAEQQFRAALAIAPTNMDAVASLVQSLASQNRLDEAQKEIDALPLVARGAQVYITLGDAYANRHRYADAAKAYQQAVAADPQDADLQKALASALMEAGEYPAALKAYTQLRQEAPEDGRAALRLGQLQMQMGQLDAARVSLDAAAKLLPSSDLEVAYAKALLDQSQHHDQAAVAGLQALIKRKTQPATQSIFLAQLARLEMQLGQNAPALAHAQQLAGLGSAYRDQALRLEIEIYAGQREFTPALTATESALKLQPDSRSLQLTRANLLAATGQTAAAQAAVRKLMHGGSQDWDLYLALGGIEMQARQWPQALRDSQQAGKLAASPAGRARAERQIGLIQAKQTHYAAAEHSYRQSLSLEPENADTLNALAYVLAQQGVRLPEALRYVQQALAQDAHNGAYLDSLGWIYYKMKRLPDAITNLEQAVHFDRHDPAILDHLAQAYEGDGKLQQAASSWTQALADLDGDPDAANATQRKDIQKKLDAVKVRLAQEQR
ncbi:MAG: tetratricopeptide repeat protein [Acidobacteria bacterium]|nr:MAG: tetratricopeptide repeat protein [Acidobacteriota bacterium]